MIFKWPAHILFYAYVALLIVAGGWGVFMGGLDQSWLLGVPDGALTGQANANALSQYRFLRGIEFGLGIFAVWQRNEVMTRSKANALFLTAMGAGIVGRTVSLIADGSPRTLFYFFLATELAGFIAILLYTRRNPKQAAAK